MSTTKQKKNSFYGAVGRVSSATALSRVLGLVREQVMAYFFGAGMATDAFVIAFRVPNLLRDMFAEGALSSAFIPIFKEKLVNESEEEAFGLARTALTGILTVVGGIVLLGIVATPAIIFISANGFTADPVKFDLTVSLTRLMFVYLLLVSLSALVMGMLNSFGRFGIPALSPAAFNLGVILSVLGLQQFLEVPVYALAIGVLVGGVAQLAVQLPPLLKLGFRFRLHFGFLDESFKKLLRLFGPMVLGLSAGRVNILVNTLLASFLVEGAISYLNYSYRLMHFPLGVFAVALGTISLPSAAEMVARRDMEGLARTYRESINLNMFLILPAAAFLALMGTDLVHLIFAWGAFDQTATANTALALLHYSYGLIGFAAVRVTVPIFYALEDSKLPMRISFVSVAVNIALYYPMIKILDFAGLAAASSIAGLLNFGMLLYFLRSKNIPIRISRLLPDFFRMAVAAILAIGAARMLPLNFVTGLSEPLVRLIEMAAMIAVGGLLYLLFSFILRVKEVTIITHRLFGRRNRA